jgi:hypothetical protein
VNLDNILTDQLLSLQQKAVELGLLAQKFEDEGNAYITQHGVGYYKMFITDVNVPKVLYVKNVDIYL